MCLRQLGLALGIKRAADDAVDICDALSVAQFDVSLGPQPFNPRAADGDLDGAPTVIDAMMIAQYDVQLPVAGGSDLHLFSVHFASTTVQTPADTAVALDVEILTDAAGGTNFPVVAGESYAAMAVADAELAVAPACAAPSLHPCSNALAHPAPAADLRCRQWLEQVGAAAAVSIRHYNRREGRFEACAFDATDGDAAAVGVDFPITPEEGYLIQALDAVEIALPDCGP